MTLEERLRGASPADVTMFTTTEVAQLLRVSRHYVTRMVREGKLMVTLDVGGYRFSLEEIRRYLAEEARP